MTETTLIPAHGGYRKLKSFQIAQLVYDVTVRLPVYFENDQVFLGFSSIPSAAAGMVPPAG